MFFDILIYLIGGISVVLALIGIGYAVRQLWRAMVFRVRAGWLLGSAKLEWYRVVPDNTKQSQNAKKRHFTISDTTAIQGLNESVFSRNWPWLDRGMISYVWLRDEEGEISLYVGITKRHRAETVINSFARSLDAKAEKVDLPPNIPTESLAIAERGNPAVADVATSVDVLGQVSETFSEKFSNNSGERGAIILTMEPSTRPENDRLRARITDRLSEVGGDSSIIGSVSSQISHMTNKMMRVSMLATSTVEDQAPHLLTGATSSVTGLGFHVNTVNLDVLRTRRMVKVFLLASFAIGAVSGIFGLLTQAPSALFGYVAAILPIVALGLASTLSEQILHGPIRANAKEGIALLPGFSWMSPRWMGGRTFFGDVPFAAKSKGSGKTAWPSVQQVFYMHPLAILEFVSFPERVSALGANISRRDYQSRGIPDSFLDVRYPIWAGKSGTDQQVFLDAFRNLHFPSYSAGSMGSGKTNYLNVLFLGAVRTCLDKPDGMRVTPIWGETKGEAADEIWDQIRHVPGSIRIDAFKKETKFRLALEGPRIGDGASPREVVANARILVNALMAAWGDQIKAESKATLISVFSIALLLSSDELEFLQIDNLLSDLDRPNIVKIAFWLVRGDLYRADIGAGLLQLAQSIESNPNADERERLLADRIQNYGRYIDPDTAKQYDALLSPPRNKLSDLLGMEPMWEVVKNDRRRDVYIDTLPPAFRPIVLNLGPQEDQEDDSEHGFNLAEARRMLVAVNSMLWNTIKSQCTGWLRENKRVVIFFDEVADVVNRGKSDDVPDALAEGLKEGRSKGTSFQIGCQFPGQLDPEVQQYVLSINNKTWFQLANSDDIDLAVRDLARGDRDNAPFSHENIGGNPTGVAAARIQIADNKISPPFTLRTPYAPKWAEFLLSDGHNLPDIVDAVNDYLMWESRQEQEKMTQALQSVDNALTTSPSRESLAIGASSQKPSRRPGAIPPRPWEEDEEDAEMEDFRPPAYRGAATDPLDDFDFGDDR